MAKYGEDYEFSMTGGKLVEAAWRLLGVYDRDEEIDSNGMADGLQAANMIVKQLMGPNNTILRGFKVWKEDDKSITFATNANSYALQTTGGDVDMDDVPVIIKSILRRNDDTDVAIRQILQEEWRKIPNKSIQTTPSRFYYENRLDAGQLYFDTIIDDLTDTYEMRYLAPFKDVTQAGTLNFNEYFYRPLLAMLAFDLGVGEEVPVTKMQMIVGMKTEGIALANSFEPEDVEDVFFEPGKD